MSFDEWWKKHWCKDIQATSKHENACRYAYTDAFGLSEQKIKELEEKLAVAELMNKTMQKQVDDFVKEYREKLSIAIEELEKMADFNVIMDRRAAASEALEKIKR